MSYPDKKAKGQYKAFSRHKMRIVLTLAAGSFPAGGNQYTIDDLAMTASIEKMPMPDFGKCQVEIIGLPLEVMEQLSTLAFKPFWRTRNYINIYAENSAGDLTQVFAGSIATAGADFNSAPDVKFKIEGQIGFFGRIQAQGQTAIHGEQPAADFIGAQMTDAGFTFQNEGVSASLGASVFSGSSIQQAQKATEQIGAELILDDNEAVLLPTGATRKGDVIELTAETGLIGYPVISQSGVELKTIFNPDLRFAGAVTVKTTVPKASGTWRIVKLSHRISANVPNNGVWESHITGYYPHLSGEMGRYI